MSLTTHGGTHVDAPWRYHSTADGGASRAPTIDEAPLDLFLRPGVKLDLFTARRFAETGDPAIVWDEYKVGRIRSYYQMVKLQNLEALPSTGFTVACLPVKIEYASADWVRAVAMLDAPA